MFLFFSTLLIWSPIKQIQLRALSSSHNICWIIYLMSLDSNNYGGCWGEARWFHLNLHGFNVSIRARRSVCSSIFRSRELDPYLGFQKKFFEMSSGRRLTHTCEEYFFLSWNDGGKGNWKSEIIISSTKDKTGFRQAVLFLRKHCFSHCAVVRTDEENIHSLQGEKSEIIAKYLASELLFVLLSVQSKWLRDWLIPSLIKPLSGPLPDWTLHNFRASKSLIRLVWTPYNLLVDGFSCFTIAKCSVRYSSSHSLRNGTGKAVCRFFFFPFLIPSGPEKMAATEVLPFQWKTWKDPHHKIST